jgi:hypothetical protein
MRRLGRFLLLCAGVLLLVGCALVTFLVGAVLFGMLVPPIGLWFLLGIPLVVVLLFGGFSLCEAFIEDEEPGDGPLERVLLGFVIVAFFATLAAIVSGAIGGPHLYQKYYGEKTTAVVSSVFEVNGENGGVLKRQYIVRDDVTGADLGMLAQSPHHETAEGDRVEVFVDPHGWVPPVAADQLGLATVPGVILACCFAVIVVAALAVIARAFGALVSARPPADRN